MSLPNGLNDLAKLTLLASDESYFSPQFPILNGSPLQPFPDTPSYNIFPQFDIAPARAFLVDRQFTDDTTGFKAIAFRNAETNEVILAFGGTDGANPQDWAANVEHLGWNQWNGDNRTAVFTYLNSLDPATKIHFTGQSLGGALAQYASYEYVRNKTVNFHGNTEFDSTFDKTRVNLTTFNAFGGQLALQRNSPGFDTTVLTGLGASAHFVIDGDLVSRLGGGHVGGPVYQLDYFSTRINPSTGQPYFLDLIEGHRIETGFYANLTPLPTFEEAKLLTPSELSAYYLPMASLQKVSGLFGNILNGKDVSPAESIPRLFAGVAAGLAFGNQSELNTLVQAVLKNQADAGKLSAAQYVALNGIRFGAFRPLATAVYPITIIAAGLVDAAELGLNGIQSAFSAVKQFLGLADTDGPSTPTGNSPHDYFEKMKAFFTFVPDALPANESLPSQQISRLNLDLDVYAQTLLTNSSSTWRTDTLAWLRTKATDVQFKPAEIDQMTVAFYNSLSTIPELDPTEITLLAQERHAFITETASGFANAMADYTQKITNVAFSLGQTISSFADIQLIDQAYAAELGDPRLSSSVRAAVEEARDIVQRAGQAVVIGKGMGPNPFNGMGFNPNDPGTISTATLPEGQLQAYTLALPFEAGTGGQRVQLQLSGTGVSALRVRAGGLELTLQNGLVTLIVPEGQRQLVFGLQIKDDVDVDGGLTLSATLVDAKNDATHNPHQEATLTVDATVEQPIDFNNGQPTLRYDGDATANHPVFTAAANHDVYGYGGNDVLTLSTSSALFNHQLFGGDDDDELSGGAGQDQLFGDAGLDVLFGGAGNDVLDGGTGDDLLNGGVGQDVLSGGLDNDSLRGDSGDDVLVGGKGDDLMFGDDRQLDPTRPIGKDYLDGGAGADWLFGGLGDDVLVGALSPFSMEKNGGVMFMGYHHGGKGLNKEAGPLFLVPTFPMPPKGL